MGGGYDAWCSLICGFVSDVNFGKFSIMFSSNITSISFTYSGIPMTYVLASKETVLVTFLSLLREYLTPKVIGEEVYLAYRNRGFGP